MAYPFGGPKRERPFLVLWILLLLATVTLRLRYVYTAGIVLLIPVAGYQVRLLVASKDGNTAPPVLVDFVVLLRRGIGGLLITACYLAVPGILLVVTIYGALYTDRVPDPASVSSLVFYAGSTTVLSVSLIGAYLLPIALVAYGRTGSLRSAFSGSALRAVATKGAYFAGWTAAVGAFGFVAAVAVSVADVARIGPVVATALLAYVSMVTTHVWGRALARV
jgi:hypothetical protein